GRLRLSQPSTSRGGPVARVSGTFAAVRCAISFKTATGDRSEDVAMTVAEFDTKVAIVVRDDLAAWQRLNVTAFLMSGVAAAAGSDAIGEDYLDADGNRSL